jgi:dihydrofolate synthase/folylpolyglutamate synthase
MDLLGNTIEKIAGEKAGIIKRKTPVIIGETQAETENVFKVKATESDSPIYFADSSFFCRLSPYENLGEGRKYLMQDLSTDHIIEGEIPLAGDYQSRNLQAVFTSFKILNEKFEISERKLINGIRRTVINTGLLGRWQILNKAPLTICDTGHNKEGLEYVLEQIKNTEKSMLHIILGFVNDKDLNSVLPLFPTDAKYYFTKASVPRALSEIKLKEEAEKYGLIGESFPDVKTAYDVSRKRAGESDLIFIGGSTFIVAEVV